MRHLLLVSLGQGEIGARVRQAREEAGLTQQELAERAGLKNGANVSRLETGRTQLTPKRMRLIAEATAKPLGFFVPDLEPVGGHHQPTPRELASAILALDEKLVQQDQELREELGRVSKTQTEILETLHEIGEAVAPSAPAERGRAQG